MGFPLAAAGASVAGSTAGTAAGEAMGGVFDRAFGNNKAFDVNDMFVTPNFVKNINSQMMQALQAAQSTYGNYNQQAIDQQKQSLAAAEGYLKDYTKQGVGALNESVAQQMAVMKPYASAGYGAMDAYQDSLGLKRASAGGEAIANALYNKTFYDKLMATNPLTTRPDAPTMAAPDYNALFANTQAGLTADKINPMIDTMISQYQNPATGKVMYYPGRGQRAPLQVGLASAQADPALRAVFEDRIRSSAMQGMQQQYNQQVAQYQAVQNQYQQQLGQYNQYAQALGNLNYSPQQALLAQQYYNTQGGAS